MAEIAAAQKISEFQARLQSVNVDGMSIDPIRAAYIVQYKGGLVGRQFKAILQVISFVLHGLVNVKTRNVWIAAGHMTSLLWLPEIDDIDAYCVRLPFFRFICYYMLQSANIYLFSLSSKIVLIAFWTHLRKWTQVK